MAAALAGGAPPPPDAAPLLEVELPEWCCNRWRAHEFELPPTPFGARRGSGSGVVYLHLSFERWSGTAMAPSPAGGVISHRTLPVGTLVHYCFSTVGRGKGAPRSYHLDPQRDAFDVAASPATGRAHAAFITDPAHRSALHDRLTRGHMLHADAAAVSAEPGSADVGALCRAALPQKWLGARPAPPRRQTTAQPQTAEWTLETSKVWAPRHVVENAFFDSGLLIRRAFRADWAHLAAKLADHPGFRSGDLGTVADVEPVMSRCYHTLRNAFKIYAAKGTATFYVFMNGFSTCCRDAFIIDSAAGQGRKRREGKALKVRFGGVCTAAARPRPAGSPRPAHPRPSPQPASRRTSTASSSLSTTRATTPPRRTTAAPSPGSKRRT